ncbi:MAG: hypothetical protein ACFCD0_09895 [Gemmataceae bacterium]
MIRISQLHCFALMAVMASIACCPEPQPTQPNLPKTIAVRVVVFAASTKDKHTDEQLKDIGAHVQLCKPRFVGFRMIAVRSESLELKKPKKFPLTKKKIVEIQILEGPNVNDKIRLSVRPCCCKRAITFSCVCGKFVPFMTRDSHGKHARLMFAVEVKSCGKAAQRIPQNDKSK